VIEKIKKQTVVETVMDKIRDLIASGEYKVNERLPTENQLAEMFGLGRSSIREAIKVFNYLGVLESRTAKGTYVCERNNITTELMKWAVLLGNDDLYEMVEVRGSIELFAILNLTEKYKNGDEKAKSYIKQLEEIINDFDKAINELSIKDIINCDFRFHNIIISSNENDTFSSIFAVLENFLWEEIKQTYKAYSDYKKISVEHNELLESIKTGDSTKARQGLLNHIDNIKDKLKEALTKE
jgi:DNA-binding FadR family transcriptional regulator